jgi:hypothetical protein
VPGIIPLFRVQRLTNEKKTKKNEEDAQPNNRNGKEEAVAAVEKPIPPQMIQESTEVAAEDLHVLVDLIGQDVTEKLADLYRLSLDNRQSKSKQTVTSDPIDDKEQRSRVHQVTPTQLRR